MLAYPFIHKMVRFGFPFLLGFSCLFLCEGAVFPPSSGTKLTFIPETTGKVVWSFADKINGISSRTWTFYPSDGQPRVDLAKINGDGDVQFFTTSYEVAIEKPATLVLKNVNLTYNGTYQFSLSPGGSASDVVVYIAVKPKATACSSNVTVNEGENVSCTCQGQGGNPPADVAWYKDNHKIGGTGKEEKTLTLTNVIHEKDHGSCKCVAQSHPNEIFQDEVIVEVIVNSKPKNTRIVVPKVAYVGEKLVINCSSNSFPAPSFTITHNITTNIVSNQSSYIENYVDYSDAGLYKCNAKNSLGRDTKSGNLIVKEKRPSTKSAPKKPTTQSTPGKTTVRTKDNAAGGSSSGLSTGAIIGISVSVPLLFVIVFVVYCWYKRTEKLGDGRNGENQDNEEPIEVDNGYEALVPVASDSKSSSPEKATPPPVYAAVDKENRLGNTLYATLDTDAMKPKRESSKEAGDHPPQTNYASIDFGKTAKAAKAEAV